jgi:hypothetical protein
MRMYATAEQLAAYPGGSDVPAEDVDVLLRTASRMVDEALLGRMYDVDAEGYPAGTDERQATTDAACAIATELHAIGYNAAGGTQTWGSVGIGSVSLSDPRAAEGTVLVMGLPVPHAAVVALRSVGTFAATTGRGVTW